jgi:hypothetical protein
MGISSVGNAARRRQSVFFGKFYILYVSKSCIVGRGEGEIAYFFSGDSTLDKCMHFHSLSMC